jgi:hypothetical protein
MNKRWNRIVTLAAAVLLGALLGSLVACTVPANESRPAAVVAPSSSAEPAPHQSEAGSRSPARQEAATPPASLIETLKTLVSTEQGIPSYQLLVKQTEAVEWSDSCLGAARANEMCAQVITPGYRIKLGTLTETFEFHTDQTGRNVRKLEKPANSESAPAEKSKRSVEAEAEQAGENHARPSPSE